ncbi:DTW domain-containing protein 1 [Strongylocentrotus purpuratus]|uniref:tRNA-uridine aminocarboxypropyltransferase 1 n=1 Tax=Strongylocentrotus purpuratus TaxID=7668 RepID=A0A7M7RDV3_STRPU|nr:DTW domain-containing protein 1 [Strongylocentrotus purpuratus]
MDIHKKRPKPTDGSNPFEGMKIASHDALVALKQRSKCSECRRSRKYFCYNCYVPVPELKDKLPIVKLPVKVDVIKHSREVDGKSTAIHAAVLAPDDVSMYTYPTIPNYDDPSEKVVLVFPSSDAVSLEEFTPRPAKEQDTTKEESKADADDKTKDAECPFQRVVFIDCTWNQTNQIYNDVRLKGLQCVVINDRKTCFWRGQRKSDSYLATIEAIYYFMVDYQQAFLQGKESKDECRYDNLLYFYSFMYGLVHQDDSPDAKMRKEDNG